MTKENTTLWDPVEHFNNEEDIAAYLEAALEENDTALIAAALGDIARAKGMSKIAEDTGLVEKVCTRHCRLPEIQSSQPS